MKVRILTPVAGVDFSFAPRQVVDQADTAADLQELINAGFAVEVPLAGSEPAPVETATAEPQGETATPPKTRRRTRKQ